MRKLLCLFCIFFVISAFPAFSQEAADSVGKQPTFRHSSKGFEFGTSDGNYLLQVGARLQFRFASPSDQNPVTFDDFQDSKTATFKINRARLKIGGHAYKPWLKYYLEYELGTNNLLDFRVMVEKVPWLKFKFGQWKVEYNRERVVSSGEQQLIDRSLINRAFTIDRQQGLTVYGNLDGGGMANFDYWAAVLTGAGRGATSNDDMKMMYFGRFQWNVLGRLVPFEGGDMEISQQPAALLAIAGVTNTSPYTRFSQSGGGYLEGYEDGLPGQYTVNQFQVESAFNYRGFSWASEFHGKYIHDNFTSGTTTLAGFYVQAGYFMHQSIDFWPEKLEIATRYAQYRPDVSLAENRQEEYALAFNYFFVGHKNKLTAELTRFVFQDNTLPQENETRIRLQYDVSF